jgi:hypothetical protein
VTLPHPRHSRITASAARTHDELVMRRIQLGLAASAASCAVAAIAGTLAR